MSDPRPEDLRKFSLALLSWVGPLLVARQATAEVYRKEVAPGSWDTEIMREAKSAVTSTDLESQAKILDMIHATWPDHSVLFEENAPPGTAERFPAAGRYLWLVDPLDGTYNYAQGQPHFGAILGVARRDTGRVVAGAIIEPVAGHAFSFCAGGGAYYGGRPFTISRPTKGAELLLDSQVPPELPAALDDEGIAWRRAYRCIVTATSRLLLGRAGAIVVNNSDLLDMAVPMALVREARGRVTDWRAEPLKDWLAPRYHTVLAGGDPVLLEELAEITGGLVPSAK